MKRTHRSLSVLATLSAAAASHAACVPAGVEPTPTAVVDAQFKAYNAHDVEAFANCYADDVRMSYLDGKHPDIEGRAGILKTFTYLAHAPKEQGVTLVHRIVTGPIVIDQEHVVGLPNGKSLPDLAAVYEVRHGLIVKVWFPPAS
jgi:hypothetical protein